MVMLDKLLTLLIFFNTSQAISLTDLSLVPVLIIIASNSSLLIFSQPHPLNFYFNNSNISLFFSIILLSFSSVIISLSILFILFITLLLSK